MCDYCLGTGACPKCWGRSAIEELKGEIARLNVELNRPATQLAVSSVDGTLREQWRELKRCVQVVGSVCDLPTETLALANALVAFETAAAALLAASPDRGPLVPAPEPREPDGWVIIYHDLSRRAVVHKEEADMAAAHSLRVHPFVYIGAPVRSEEV